MNIEWQKEPETTVDNNEHGFLHYKGMLDGKVIFELRFDYKNGRDIWALEYLPTNRIWTRDGIAAYNTLQSLAKHYIEHHLKK